MLNLPNQARKVSYHVFVR